MIAANWDSRTTAWSGKRSVGAAFASLNQNAWTCAGLTPAIARRWSTTVQKVAAGFEMIAAVCPPWAPFTRTTAGFLAGSAFAIGRRAVNSALVFDIPIERRTILPFGSGAPARFLG